MEVESDVQPPESGSQDSSPGSEETEEETTVETKEEEEKEKLEEEGEDEEDSSDEDNDEAEEPTIDPTPEQQENKDPSIQELEESIVSIIGILINEGKDFDIKNSRLYKQYTISSKLVELKKTIDSWQAKKAQEAKDAQAKGASASTEQQSK